MSRKERQAYYRGVKNTIQFLLVSGFYTYLLCEIVIKLFWKKQERKEKIWIWKFLKMKNLEK